MRVKIIDSTGVEWYSNHMEETFYVEAIPRRGFKYIIVKFDDKRYGYVNKDHCIPIYDYE